MVKHFPSIPIFERRCVILQINKNAQNDCLSAPTPNAFYGDSSQNFTTGKVPRFISRISLIITPLKSKGIIQVSKANENSYNNLS